MTWSTYASEKIIGGFLTQNGHPVTYVSQNLSKSEQNYSNPEREVLVVIFAVTCLQQFLIGRKMTIKIDHKLLPYMCCRNNQLPKVLSPPWQDEDNSDGSRL